MIKILGALLALCASVAFGATTLPVQLLNPTGSTAGQAAVSTGPTTPPTWGSVSGASLAAQAANTVLANVTGSSASPTAFAMPSCSVTGDALIYTSGTGFVCVTGYAPLASPAFTTAASVTSSATSGYLLTLSATSNTSTGAAINMTGNGATTPAKTIRVSSGLFQVVNSANTVGIFSMDDSGNVTITGSLTASQTGGVIGTTTNNNAIAGSVGEYQTGTSSAVSVTNNTPVNCASVPLTAGDWDVSGDIEYTPAASTTWGNAYASINSTSATLPGFPNETLIESTGLTTGTIQIFVTPVVRESLASSGTAYLVGQANFGVSTMTCTGFIRARRIR